MSGAISLALGALGGAIAVALGAFGAHALKAKLPIETLSVFQTGVQYQMMHSLALIAVGLWIERQPDLNLLGYAVAAFLFGMVCFSGSLYAFALGGPRWLGPVTPLGGSLFIVGWLLLAVAALSQQSA